MEEEEGEKRESCEPDERRDAEHDHARGGSGPWTLWTESEYKRGSAASPVAVSLSPASMRGSRTRACRRRVCARPWRRVSR